MTDLTLGTFANAPTVARWRLPPSTFSPIGDALARAAADVSRAVADRTNMLAAAYYLETDAPVEIVTEQQPGGWTWVYMRPSTTALPIGVRREDAIEPAMRFARECPGYPASGTRIAYGMEGLTAVVRFEAHEATR